MQGMSTVSRGVLPHLRQTPFFCSAARLAFSLSILCNSASTVSEVTVAIFFSTVASEVFLIVSWSFSIFSLVVWVVFGCRSEPVGFDEFVSVSVRPLRPEVVVGTGEEGVPDGETVSVTARERTGLATGAGSGAADKIARTSGVLA